MSPTQESLKYLRNDGWTVAIVEKKVPHSFISQDLFGFIDLIAIHPDSETTIGIQVTTTANISARRAKILAHKNYQIWKASPYRRMIIHGWSKKGKRGERKWWTLTEVEL